LTRRCYTRSVEPVGVFDSAPGARRRAVYIGTAMLVLSGVALLAAVTDRSALAAFPGENGRIAFDSNRDGDFEIFRMNADGSQERRLTNNDDTDYGAAFSPNGKRIAFYSDRDGNGEIYLMRADGTKEHNVSKNDAQDNEPFFTPSGKRIVFQSDRGDGEDDDIFSMRLDGTHVHPLTKGPADDGAPTVSTDGRIAWVRGQEIWIMRADGSHKRGISDVDDNYPNFSPNGKRIVFERVPDGEDIELFVMRTNGKHRRRLTNNDDQDFAPVFSPDGKKIAWDGGPLGNVRVMRTDRTHKHRLTLSPSVDEYADWAPRR
jgi:Tol biopolymer transport system component